MPCIYSYSQTIISLINLKEEKVLQMVGAPLQGNLGWLFRRVGPRLGMSLNKKNEKDELLKVEELDINIKNIK